MLGLTPSATWEEVERAYRQKAKQMKQHELARRLSRPPGAATPLEEIVSADEIDRLVPELL